MTITALPDSYEKVLDTASAIVADSGVETISIKRLTDESGVSNGSIYHHFGSRDGVIAALVIDVIGDYQGGAQAVLDQNEDDARGGIVGLVNHHLEWVETNYSRAELLLFQRDKVTYGPQGDRLSNQNREFFSRVQAWMTRQSEAGRMPETDFATAHALILAPAQDVTRGWVLGRTSRKPTVFAPRLAPAAWAAISAEPGGGR